jgi:AraC-like DNA-binding protein
MFRPSNKLRAYLDRAREAGIDPAQILAGSCVAGQDIDSIPSLDPDVVGELFGHLARSTPPGFALSCGRASKIIDFGVVGLAMMSMPTLRDAFELWNRYSLVAGQPLVTTISESGDHWQMHFMPQRLMSAEAQRFCIEASVAALSPIVEQLTGQPPHTLGIDFSFDRPASADDYAMLGTANIRFGRQPSTYHGLRSDLDRKVAAADREVGEQYRLKCAEYFETLAGTRCVSEQLEDLIRTSVGSIPTLDELAARRQTSRRSLQRELAKEGLTYQTLIRRFRERHATELLAQGQTNIKTIAYMLGFDDVGSFRRAFQDWTGQSISAWKSAQRQPGLASTFPASAESAAA